MTAHNRQEIIGTLIMILNINEIKNKPGKKKPEKPRSHP